MSSSSLRLGAVLLVVIAALGACGSDDPTTDDGADLATSSTAATSSATVATTTTQAPRAFVVPATVPPLLSSTSTIATDPDTVPLDELAVGDCVDIADAESDAVAVGTARRRACDEPHGLEVFQVASLNEDPNAPYPGDEAVLGGADQLCLDAFEPYVGIAYVDSSLEIAHLRPDENVWLHGDRIVRCVVQDRSLEPLVGTVQGTGR